MGVTIDAPGGPMAAHLSRPDSGEQWPGVLVVHDALGMTADLRCQADWLAENGYLALAPDLYHRGGRLRCMFSTLRALAAGRGPVFDDLEAARSRLVAQPGCSGRVGIIGFCMGGNIALMLAGARAAQVRGAVLCDGPGLWGGPSGPTSADFVVLAPSDGSAPDPYALHELSKDLRPADYAALFVRLAMEHSGLDEPLAVAGVVRPPWLEAVVREVGVVECSREDALARFAAL